MKKLILLIIIITTVSCAVKKTKKMDKIISTEELKSTREFFNGLGKIYKPDVEVQQGQEIISGIVCYSFTPPNINNKRLVLYAHGGSFALGGIESHKAMMTHLAKTTQTKIIFVEYALAPENPFPNGVNDFFEVYKGLKSKNENKKIFVCGDSAGCGIILSSMGKLQNKKIQKPNGVIFISPWLNLYCNSESYFFNKENDPIIKKEELVKYANLYIGNSDLKNVSPSNLSFPSFPPNLVAVGKNEVLLQDSKDFNKKLKNVQSKSFLLEFENVTHVWPLTDINSKSTKSLFTEISNFLDNETN
ncbi:alpha/beta hydrolase fold domain-containing protein [Tamlana sp. 2_MG-2023]|uniref:alpha/beta hydrolase fold domain-containing protein n=1 Tax=unclassified Tamlana TaxID=2614803 RepID=UPI0026E2565B|nr:MULTISPECIES: alpha/beta hydrolase fold domain-containing protein [unclassified Tamlana]MDO6761713.1 alpha/beta hydrolase fold domain-containing protein [Tamlana sp. 2_MG-2023]MDO6792267.1 alpha/beta hydrolase fold domain-containing protein [Tamlana sp. 1_MG-2023]